MQLRISVFMLFFVLKRSLKLMTLEMDWLLCDFKCFFFLIEDNLTYNYYMTKFYNLTYNYYMTKFYEKKGETI